MCIACELGFLSMLDALSPEERERILRQHDAATRMACDAPPEAAPPSKDEPAP